MEDMMQDQDATIPSDAVSPEEQRPRKRTTRMRVFNFRPLVRPHTEEAAAPTRSASPSKTP
jgi:hypothetical protein